LIGKRRSHDFTGDENRRAQPGTRCPPVLHDFRPLVLQGLLCRSPAGFVHGVLVWSRDRDASKRDAG
jgi:hypothetical protein